MTRDSRQRYIKQMMALGSKFEDIYKESDGTPRFTWFVYPVATFPHTHTMSNKSQEEIEEYCASINATFKRIDLLGYEIED